MKGLKLLRQKKHYSQAQLAAIMNVGQTSIARWEQGKSVPNKPKLHILAQVLGCSVGFLFDGANPTQQVQEKKTA